MIYEGNKELWYIQAVITELQRQGVHLRNVGVGGSRVLCKILEIEDLKGSEVAQERVRWWLPLLENCVFHDYLNNHPLPHSGVTITHKFKLYITTSSVF
jgi:hypothetical protein